MQHQETSHALIQQSEREPLLPQPQQDGLVSTTTPGDDGILASTIPSENNESTLDLKNPPSIEFADKLRILAVLFAFFVSGMIATVVGALLPQLEEYYNLTDSKAAFVFTASTVGYICGTLTLTSVVSRYGWRGVAFLTPLSVIFMTGIMSTAPPFMVVLFVVFFGGVGNGLMDAGFNAWASKLAFVNVVQGFLHGTYSVGSVMGPMLYAGLVKREMNWYIFYRIMFILSMFEMAAAAFTFRTEDAKRFKESHDTIGDGVDLPPKKGLSRSKVVLLIGIFYFFYIAVETSYYNWMPSFMQRVRHADPPTASISSSVFWVGMAIGRLGLGVVTEHFGLSISVAMYLIIAICLQVVFCFVETIRTSFILLALNGFILGPMFPSGIILISRSLANDEYIGGVAAATAMGQAGGALAPLGIGFMAERFGLKHLSEVILTSTSLDLIVWVIASRMTRLSQ